MIRSVLEPSRPDPPLPGQILKFCHVTIILRGGDASRIGLGMRICCRLSTVLHMTQTTGGNAATAGRLVLLRHGQTVWSESGQHTGRTDIPLTAEGERQARDAGTRIQTAFPQGFGENCVYASPLKRPADGKPRRVRSAYAAGARGMGLRPGGGPYPSDHRAIARRLLGAME